MNREFGKIIVLLIFLSFCFAVRNTWGLRYLEDIQENAPSFIKSNGFEVIGSQGYQTNTFMGTARVWYTVKKDDLVYECAVVKRNYNYHLYCLRVLNAVNISTSQ